ncbi:hypothetical protein GCM10020295_19930 [Streptomyces cinereospinus]
MTSLPPARAVVWRDRGHRFRPMVRPFVHIAPLSPDDPSELGGYELLGRIGQGGMGGDFQGSRQRPDRGPNQG